MDIKAYIESGILELYALGDLSQSERAVVVSNLQRYPALQKELHQIEVALENYANLRRVMPRAHVKQRLMESIQNLQKEEVMDPTDLPLLHKGADHEKWLRFIESLGPLTLGDDGRHIRVLQHHERLTQLLIVSTTAFEEEVHENVHESFLILSGACRCTVGNQVT
ncbi:MAG: hypothetical protein REI93_01185, partial [Pedobacter sp.]|nr:hypothetical protein [Pedobacter sp.]